ncbi:MAG: type VI secretion system baseplate subunit TssK, partial [Planctomycetota bacterium]
MSRAIPGVLWEEGQMLLPQHLQAAQNHYQELVSQLTLGRTYSYGVKSMQIREASIGNWAFEVPSCEIVMPDGTYLVAGETAEIAPVEFRQLQTEGSTLEVWLGIPFFTSSGPNLLDGSSSEEATGAFGRRYIAASMELRDENSGGNPQEIRCRKLNARIFVGRRPEQGYTTLKIAELKKVNVEGDDGRVYALSEQFVPASLSLEAAPRLFRIVRDLLDILEEKNEELHHQLGREDM